MYNGRFMHHRVLGACLCLAGAMAGTALAQTGFICYQGVLKSNGAPVDGPMRMRFSLWNALAGGSQIGSTFNAPDGVNVADGWFSTDIDTTSFGVGAFNGQSRWLEVAVSPDNSVWTTLNPRQQVQPTPYALYAMTCGGGGAGPWSSNGADIHYTAGYVGIGIESPQATLDVHNTLETAIHAQGNRVGIHGASLAGESDPNFMAVGVLGSVGPSGVNRQAIRGYAEGGGNYAGYFVGNVRVAGNLSKTTGSFKIDHPLDPENKYLYHSFVESPDMMNVYNGNVVLDDAGQGVITLPDWFEALNGDYRYQLTPIGGPGPNLHVAGEIKNNRFAIAGGSPGLRVSWQVTGIRRDPYAVAHRIPVEEDKPPAERGAYIDAQVYDQPVTKQIDYIHNERMRRQAHGRNRND